MGFEMILVNTQPGLVSLEGTMMAMFLRCLKFVFGEHQVQRESALWWSRKERHAEQRSWFGTGWVSASHCQNTGIAGSTLYLIGAYCVSIHSSQTKSFFVNDVLHGQYLRHRAELQAFFFAIQKLEMALGWLERYKQNPATGDRLIS